MGLIYSDWLCIHVFIIHPCYLAPILKTCDNKNMDITHTKPPPPLSYGIKQLWDRDVSREVANKMSEVNKDGQLGQGSVVQEEQES